MNFQTRSRAVHINKRPLLCNSQGNQTYTARNKMPIQTEEPSASTSLSSAGQLNRFPVFSPAIVGEQ